jgi:transposase-like protein
MSKVNRNAPKRSSASDARFTIFEFEREFPDDAACMDYLVKLLYPFGITCPTCNTVTKHHRRKDRTAYSCQFCGHDEYPMKGTIFEGSATSLKLWFYAIHLMASTRCGISAKQLERETCVTYKTAWRMFNKIRSLVPQDDEFLSGVVEMDEAYIGPNAKWMHKDDPRRGLRGRGVAGKSKTPVFGMAQRGASGAHGRVVAKVVDGVSEAHLGPHIRKRVLPASVVYTDDWGAYDRLGKEGYEHSRVAHTQGVYVSGDVHTNTIEGFWMLVKSGIRGAYHGVSTKHLQSYLDEFAFRYNNRDATGRGMFDAFLYRIRKASPEAS